MKYALYSRDTHSGAYTRLSTCRKSATSACQMLDDNIQHIGSNVKAVKAETPEYRVSFIDTQGRVRGMLCEVIA